MQPLRVIIADGGSLPRSELLRVAEDAGFDILGEAHDLDHLRELVATRGTDLVLASGDPSFAARACSLGAASLVVAPDALAAKEFGGIAAFAVLTPEVPPEIVSATAMLAVARAGDLQRARREAGDLRDALETRKLVERAKGVLMRRMRVDEAAAYRRMQKASQDENRKMREIAESILSAERVFGEQPATDERSGVPSTDPR